MKKAVSFFVLILYTCATAWSPIYALNISVEEKVFNHRTNTKIFYFFLEDVERYIPKILLITTKIKS